MLRPWQGWPRWRPDTPQQTPSIYHKNPPSEAPQRHETTGQAVVAFVILRGDAVDAGDAIVQEVRNHVGKEIGPIAKPKTILVVPELPKTRSGKIVRRPLKDVAEGRDPGDATTLSDPTILKEISAAHGRSR
jgi:acyl-CoA synthetase (AMP-forming)/AMP-acid ligase II